MPLYRASLQTLGAIVLLALALACHGKRSNANTTATITGTITYLRVPLAKDVNGVPTGLADATVPANLQTLPAQGVGVRIYQQVAETNPDGVTTTNVWVLAASTYTSTTGVYSVTATTNRLTMVELTGEFGSGGGQAITLIADPQGINSTIPVSDRMQYAMRKAADGTTTGIGLTAANAPTSMFTADSTVNFSIGLNDEWWVYNPSIISASGVSAYVDQAVLETTIPGRTPGLGTGSRVMGIGDTIASFVAVYGSATPGAALDLHYWPGVDSGGSYVVYDRSLIPLSLVSGTYFGTLRGGSTNDDAWDPGVILPMLARNVLYAGNQTRTFSVPLNPIYPPGVPLPDLSPDVARIEGLANAMAANVLQSPYLADTQGTGLAAPLVDIRNLSGLSSAQLTPYSAPAIQAFAWEIILVANGLPSPGAASDWISINPLASTRFFLPPGGPTNGATDSTARDIEPLNIYTQINRLKETKSSTDPVDLASVFSDSVLSDLGTPFGITWPRPSTGLYASFVSDWGSDPTGAFPSVVLSMSKGKTQVNLPNFSVSPAVSFTTVYPNVSEGEVFYAGFSLSADKRCTLTAVITPALGAGAGIDVDLPMMQRTFTFQGTGGTTDPIVIPVSNLVPFYHPVRLHLNSPTSLQQDVTVTLTLTPTP